MKKIVAVLFGLLLAAPVAFASNDLGTLQEYIPVDKVLQVGLNPSPTGNWYVVSNSNAAVATANLAGGNLVVMGIKPGTAGISVCSETQGVHCLDVVVTVTGSILGAHITRFTHPVHSWLLHAGTVFYVYDTGLIPVSNWSIFISNGGHANQIEPMNEDDMHMPLLPLMVANDSRVQ